MQDLVVCEAETSLLANAVIPLAALMIFVVSPIAGIIALGMLADAAFIVHAFRATETEAP